MRGYPGQFTIAIALRRGASLLVLTTCAAIWSTIMPGRLAAKQTVDQDIAATASRMTVRQARKALLTSLTRVFRCPDAQEEPLANIRVTPDSFQFFDKGQYPTGGWGFHWHPYADTRSFAFRDIGGTSVKPIGRYGPFNFEELCNNYRLYSVPVAGYGPAHDPAVFKWADSRDAESFAAALTRLASNARGEHAAEDAAAAETFRQSVATWRALSQKPELPEQARVHRVLAENAVQEKDFEKAIDEYELALEMYPTWPEGQFNAAILYGELKDYDPAIRHMRSYLELVPDAPDAKAARDKLIIWQDKLGR